MRKDGIDSDIEELGDAPDDDKGKEEASPDEFDDELNPESPMVPVPGDTMEDPSDEEIEDEDGGNTYEWIPDRVLDIATDDEGRLHAQIGYSGWHDEDTWTVWEDYNHPKKAEWMRVYQKRGRYGPLHRRQLMEKRRACAQPRKYSQRVDEVDDEEWNDDLRALNLRALNRIRQRRRRVHDIARSP